MTIEELLDREEGQTFDRKSVKIEPKALADPICAFANADGGVLAIGITNSKRDIEGVDYEIDKLNEILRVPLDFCNPTVEVNTEMVPCIDIHGRNNHVLVFYIDPSAQMHANQADEVFMRVGDKSKKLAFQDRVTLMYDKGMRYFEDSPVADAELSDINLDFVAEYIRKIEYGKSVMEYLRENKNFIREKGGEVQISAAAILLFGCHPQTYFPRARTRVIRYDGISERFGTEMNVIKDMIFEGTILQQVREAIKFLGTQIKEKTYLGADGLFRTDEEYPKYVREEIIVNALTHRDYSIKGTDIQIKMFNDRIVVESPGKLPGLVRTDNIRQTHFSRNPKIAEFLKAYKYVKEFGEGVNRMYEEMEKAGLPEPAYRCRNFMVEAIIRSNYTESMNEFKRSEIRSEESVIDYENTEIEQKRSEIQQENPRIDSETLEIAVGKLSEKEFASKIKAMKYNIQTRNKLLLIYNNIETNQIFGSGEISKMLNCAASTGSELTKKLRDMQVIVEIKGLGKGKMRLKYKGE